MVCTTSVSVCIYTFVYMNKLGVLLGYFIHRIRGKISTP